MAVSAIARGFQIFSGLGAVATTPLAIQFANRQPVINSRGDKRLMSDDNRQEPTQPQEKPVSAAEAVLKEAVKRLEEKGEGIGKTGCFWLPNKYSKLDLFMCVNTETLKPLVMFHYDWSRRDKSLDERLNEVTEVTYVSSSDIKMKFENGQTENISRLLTSSFAWLREWGESMIPRKHCSLAPKNGSSQHRLTCKKEGKKGGFNNEVNPESTDSQSTKLKIS